MTRIYSPDDIAELERLYHELPVAIARAAAALQAHDAPVEAERLRHSLGENQRIAAIRQRIEAIRMGSLMPSLN